MIEITGDLWTYPANWRVITVNGTVKKDGSAVLGRGCAKEAVQRFRVLPMLLGRSIKAHGNRLFRFPELELITFPVKHNWWEKADLALIEQSMGQLTIEIIAIMQEAGGHWPVVVMPRPGCGNGGRTWAEVKPIMQPLPDCVHIITFDK